MAQGTCETKAKKRNRVRGATLSGPSVHPLTAELDQRLLALGGRQVIYQQFDTRVPDLLARGRVFDLTVVHVPGEPHDCHANAAGIWARDTGTYTLVTGYALAGRAWFAHSLVVDSAWLYETTTRFDRYFGVALDEEDAAGFWSANYLPSRYPVPTAILSRIGLKALAEAAHRKPTTLPMKEAES